MKAANKKLTSYIEKQLKLSDNLLAIGEVLQKKIAKAVNNIPADLKLEIHDIYKLTQMLDLILKQANENFERGTAIEKIIETLKARL